MRHRRTNHRRRFEGDRMRRHWVRRRLAAADDVTALEAYQRDLEQEAADVAQRIRALKAQAS
jgi:hypothetical protein